MNKKQKEEVIFEVEYGNHAFLEGLNSKICTAMRRAFGFKKLENLIAIIYLIANDQISEFLPTQSWREPKMLFEYKNERKIEISRYCEHFDANSLL